MDLNNTASIRGAGYRAEVFLFVCIESASAAHYDSISTSVPQVFHAEKQNKSNIQVSISLNQYYLRFSREK